MNGSCVALVPFLLLAACSPTGSDETVEPQKAISSNESASPVNTDSSTSPHSLVGEYRVAGIDGEPLDTPVGMAVSIDPETIELERCAGLLWSYTYTDGMIETRRAPPPDGGIICRITSEVAAAGEAIDAASSARRTPANGLELAGGGHSVLLFGQ